MAENALLEKMLDLPEFTITDLQHNDYDIRIYVVKKDKPSVCPICGSISPKVRVHNKFGSCTADFLFKLYISKQTISLTTIDLAADICKLSA